VGNGTPLGTLKGYSAGIVTDEAIHWLLQWRDKTKPFFLFTCYHEPHEPIATAPEFARDYPSDDPSYTAYWGNVAQLDAHFGRLMAELDKQKLRDNTLVLLKALLLQLFFVFRFLTRFLARFCKAPVHFGPEIPAHAVLSAHEILKSFADGHILIFGKMAQQRP
jgi:arylsulfatase A-like enzyme